MKPQAGFSFIVTHLALFSMLTLMPGHASGQAGSRGPQLITKEEVSRGKPHGLKALLGVTPDGGRVAYADAGPNVFVDGVRIGKYEVVFANTFIFSPDGQHFAYGAVRDGKAFVVVDGTDREQKYDDVGFLVYSPDSRRLAFPVVRGGTWFIVIDGKEGKAYESLSRPVFSPDGQRLAFAAMRDGKWFLVVEGTEGKTYSDVGDPVFSSDGSHIAHWVERGGRDLVVLDGVEGPDYEHSEFVTPKERLWNPRSIAIASDGKRLAYVAQRGKRVVVVVNGSEDNRGYTDAFGLSFSPDGRRLGYCAVRQEKRYVVVDGVEYPTGERSLPIWSPNVFLELPLFRIVYPVFSPDSRHFAFVRSAKPNSWHHPPKQLEIAVDGVGSGSNGGPAGFGWVGPNTIAAIVYRDQEYFRTVLEFVEAHEGDVKKSDPLP